jgi:peptidyl-prolyl cis-trans isomerase B (cyclophilin B)
MRSNLIRLTVAGVAGVLLSAVMAVPSSATPAAATHGPCQFTPTPEDPAARPVPLPFDPPWTQSFDTHAVLRTSHGNITMTLTSSKAPCTVRSFQHLILHRFYNQTTCHRLTAYPTLSVLQCGDPSGTGSGGPGYRYKDELPTDLPPVPDRPDRVVYPRGTLAMANAGPDTNGSQFFLVYADSILRPNYTVFGRISESGMAALDAIAAGGIQPTPENPAPVDGTPVLRADIAKACVYLFAWPYC